MRVWWEHLFGAQRTGAPAALASSGGECCKQTVLISLTTLVGTCLRSFAGFTVIVDFALLPLQTAANHLQLYSLNVSSEAVWRLPNGRDMRRVNVYLSHRWAWAAGVRSRLCGWQHHGQGQCCSARVRVKSCSCHTLCECLARCVRAASAHGALCARPSSPGSIHLDYGTVRIADLGGDARSLLVALSNGTMQVFSWQGKVRGMGHGGCMAVACSVQMLAWNAQHLQPAQRPVWEGASARDFGAVPAGACPLLHPNTPLPLHNCL